MLIDNISLRKQNKGYSLVELIIAVSIGAIVASAVGALISFSVRMYSTQSMNTVVQKELQMTVNQIVDSAQSASWFAFENNGSKTDYIAFGKIVKTDEDDGSGGTVTKQSFVGEVFVAGVDDGSASGRFNIYMDRFAPGVLEVTSESDAKSKIETKVTNMEAEIASGNAEKYLLGEDASTFFIDFAKKPDGSYQNFDDTEYTFSNPISFDLDICYERTGFGANTVSREINDEVTLRNRISTSLYLGSQEYKPGE